MTRCVRQRAIDRRPRARARAPRGRPLRDPLDFVVRTHLLPAYFLSRRRRVRLAQLLERERVEIDHALVLLEFGRERRSLPLRAIVVPDVAVIRESLRNGWRRRSGHRLRHGFRRAANDIQTRTNASLKSP